LARPSQKETIHRAALACFAERGYDATRIKHIAERAGVSEGAMYRHHPSKEAIARELYATAIGDHVRLLDAAAQAPGTALDRLAGMARATLGAYRARPDAFVFALHNTGSLMPGLPEGSEYPLHVIERAIAGGQREGLVRPGPTNVLAAAFAGCVLQPVSVAVLSRQGALDLLGTTEHDGLITEAAVAAVRSSS
jgi:AcrR family transcriptional regulator